MIKITDLKKHFIRKKSFLDSGSEIVKAVDGVSFSVEKGKTFGLVGESGCGKSTIARLIVGILKPDSGEISLEGGRDIVFQDPFSSLNPRMTVREIVGESLFIRNVSKDEITSRVIQTLHAVKLDSGTSMKKYPHQFSGGERQRIAIARALISRPEILVLDESVSSLDVSIQAGILNLLKDLQEEDDLTYIFITHDLRVAEFMSDFIGVMKEGKLVEIAPSEELYSAPKNEYTRHLLNSIPQ